MLLEEAKAVVTGAAGGLGGTFVLELLRAGAAVMAGDANAAGLRQLKARARDLPGRLFAARLDITDEASVVSFVEQAAEEMGGVNVLINSAGIARDGLLVASGPEGLKKLPLVQWRKVVDVNLTGQFLITREVAARMIEDGGRDGVIVNLSSLSREGHPGQANYAASKAGLDACTRTWALELAQHGIRVGGIAPGVIETGFLRGIAEEAKERLLEEIPLGRAGRPEDIWLGVKFVLECDFFTGRTLEVDGGASMGRPL